MNEKPETNSAPQFSVDRIKIWSCGVPQEVQEYFEVTGTGEEVGCNNENCNHVSHDPATTYKILKPRDGILKLIGEKEMQNEEGRVYYYALFLKDKIAYVKIKAYQWYHAIASILPSAPELE